MSRLLSKERVRDLLLGLALLCATLALMLYPPVSYTHLTLPTICSV